MAQYAVVANNVVVNLVEWDGVSAWSPPAGTTASPTSGAPVSIGWLWNAGVPTDPNPPPAVVVTQTQQAAPVDMSVIDNHAPAIQALMLAVAAANPTLTATQLRAAFAAAWKALPAAQTTNSTV
jgi:hypothetical protein